MTIPPPITLKHTRRDLAKIAAFCVLFPLALGSVVWGVEGLHDAILSAAALEVAFGIIFVVCVGTRLRYGPGRSIEYRCFGRTKPYPSTPSFPGRDIRQDAPFPSSA